MKRADDKFAPKRKLRFGMPEIIGHWRSYGGAPGIRIYRNTSHRGYYLVEFTYDKDTVLLRPVKQYRGIYYFDLYGWIRISYDTERDMLHLDGYGDYYREDE